MRGRRFEKSDEIRIYKCRHIPTLGSPIVLLVVGRDDEYFIGETYILFGDHDSSFLAERTRLRSGEFAEADPRFKTPIDLKFLLDSMLGRAEAQINDRAFQITKSHPEMLGITNWFALTEGTARDLLNLYLRGGYSDHMKQSAKQTLFLDLCRLLNRFDALDGFSVEQVDTDPEV